jgi:hypothetical protein
MIIVVEVIGILWENGEIGQKKKKKKKHVNCHTQIINLCVIYMYMGSELFSWG